MRFIKLLPALLFIFSSICITAQYSHKEHVELGQIKWLRSLTEAKSQAAEAERPILILFQEVPGCATCKMYGSNTLSHPLLVEAVESLFTPLCIFNNEGGKDKTVLTMFKEPSWNNPVVRVIDHEMNELAPRLGNNYSKLALLRTMVRALVNSSLEVPEYLYTLEQEFEAEIAGTKKRTYSMYCFWSGEKAFGEMEGVVATTAGFANGREVVEVIYNPEVIDPEDLDEYASENSCRQMANPGKFKKDKTPKYYLSNSLFRFVPMTELQKSRVNSALGNGENPLELLSPRQYAFYKKVKAKEVEGENMVEEMDFEYAWNSQMEK